MKHTVSTSFATPDGQYRVYACDACHRYLKAYDGRRASRPVMPVVDSIATLPLDAAASAVPTIKTAKSGTVEILLNAKTAVSRDQKKVPRSELKKGRTVVVDGIGDSIFDLEAIEIKIVPAPANR